MLSSRALVVGLWGSATWPSLSLPSPLEPSTSTFLVGIGNWIQLICWRNRLRTMWHRSKARARLMPAPSPSLMLLEAAAYTAAFPVIKISCSRNHPTCIPNVLLAECKGSVKTLTSPYIMIPKTCRRGHPASCHGGSNRGRKKSSPATYASGWESCYAVE